MLPAELAQVCFDVMNAAKRSCLYQPLDLCYDRIKPVIVSHRNDNARFGAGCNRAFSIGSGEREWLFREDVLARRRSLNDLSDVLGIRSDEAYRIHTRIGERPRQVG
jgi:hypothetical protein